MYDVDVFLDLLVYVRHVTDRIDAECDVYNAFDGDVDQHKVGRLFFVATRHLTYECRYLACTRTDTSTNTAKLL
jgi:hypothetical protein